MRIFGAGVLAASLLTGLASVASSAEIDTAEPAPAATTPPADETQPKATTQVAAEPWAGYPVTLETNFARPYKAISSRGNSDFTQLNDLERIIRGSYRDPRSGKIRPSSVRKSNTVFLSVSRMENSYRVGRELIRAAKQGVTVRVIHGKASQSKESRALQRALKSRSLRNANFKICSKGKSLACLSSLNGAIMHSKLLLVSSTFTRDNKPAKGVIWTGSANLGGPSGERTYNNGLTVYNDKKLWYQTRRLWDDMYAERNIGNDYLKYVKKHKGRYGFSTARREGYTRASADYGMFYSNLANVTIYATPIRATPSNGKDPVLNLLKRIVPDDQCRIRLQENRFKYRRIAVAHKLVELADAGCKVSVVAFEDDLKVNRVAHCQLYIRVCRPILDVFKTASRRIEVAWAKPHDKTIMVEAKLTRNRLNPEEVAVDGTTSGNWPYTGIRTKIVQAGSAALTGSNLVASDEITTETTDPAVYEDYLQHWKAILNSREIHNYPARSSGRPLRVVGGFR
ncbi:phospholipase D-like domain-containing protein [Aeromicrobium sp. P5_D10]